MVKTQPTISLGYNTPGNQTVYRPKEAHISENGPKDDGSQIPDSNETDSDADEKEREIEHMLKMALYQLDDVHRMQDAHRKNAVTKQRNGWNPWSLKIQNEKLWKFLRQEKIKIFKKK